MYIKRFMLALRGDRVAKGLPQIAILETARGLTVRLRDALEQALPERRGERLPFGEP
jgi:hypothetical protein